MARNALVLSLGGAPHTWHTIDGLPGLYHPAKPVPIPGEMDIVRKWHEQPGCPVRLVSASKKQLDESRAELEQMRGALLKAIRAEQDIAPIPQLEAAIDAVTPSN